MMNTEHLEKMILTLQQSKQKKQLTKKVAQTGQFLPKWANGQNFNNKLTLIGHRLSSYSLLSDVHCPGQIPNCHINIFCSFFHVM